MSKAKRCTRLEVHALNHWRREGVVIGLNDPIPLSDKPEPFARRRPILYILACALIMSSAITMGCTWLAVGAGLIK
ncbi:hypothetical protein D3C76_554100 [compost metagenome]